MLCAENIAMQRPSFSDLINAYIAVGRKGLLAYSQRWCIRLTEHPSDLQGKALLFFNNARMLQVSSSTPTFVRRCTKQLCRN